MWATLRQSDPAETNLTFFFKQEHGPFPGYYNVRGLAKGMDPVFLILCDGYPVIVVVASAAAGNSQGSLHLIPQFLKHPHEFRVHLGSPASTSAIHLIDREFWGDHLNHKDPRGENELTA